MNVIASSLIKVCLQLSAHHLIVLLIFNDLICVTRCEFAVYVTNSIRSEGHKIDTPWSTGYCLNFAFLVTRWEKTRAQESVPIVQICADTLGDEWRKISVRSACLDSVSALAFLDSRSETMRVKPLTKMRDYLSLRPRDTVIDLFQICTPLQGYCREQCSTPTRLVWRKAQHIGKFEQSYLLSSKELGPTQFWPQIQSYRPRQRAKSESTSTNRWPKLWQGKSMYFHQAFLRGVLCLCTVLFQYFLSFLSHKSDGTEFNHRSAAKTLNDSQAVKSVSVLFNEFLKRQNTTNTNKTTPLSSFMGGNLMISQNIFTRPLLQLLCKPHTVLAGWGVWTTNNELSTFVIARLHLLLRQLTADEPFANDTRAKALTQMGPARVKFD